jgi:DNA polymerase-3 subunit epsilon
MNNIFPEPLVFCDLETTGANFANDRIIEIGLIEADSDGVREWSSLVNPDAPISAFISGLTGIDTEMVSTAPSFEQLAPLLLDKLRGRLFVAHNARFDYGFLKREFKRIGIDFRQQSLCTVKLSRKLFPQHHRHSLDTLVERYGLKVADRHRALADARVLWDLWRCWHDLLPDALIHQEVATLVGRPELPPQLDGALIDDLPEAPGAYALYGQDGKTLQVKRSTNIRQQVLALFAANKRDTALVKNTFRVDWRETAGEIGARLQECELSRTTRKTAEALCSWQLIQHARDDFRPTLVFAQELDFATADDLFGLYANQREAILALRKIAEANRLCYSQLGLGESESGKPCFGYKQKTCRGACVGKETLSVHSARLMTALAKFKLKTWPYSGPVGILESDEFGMRTDFHLLDRWRYLGTVHKETELPELMDSATAGDFEPDIYRIFTRFLQAGKARAIPLTPLF